MSVDLLFCMALFTHNADRCQKTTAEGHQGTSGTVLQMQFTFFATCGLVGGWGVGGGVVGWRSMSGDDAEVINSTATLSCRKNVGAMTAVRIDI